MRLYLTAHILRSADIGLIVSFRVTSESASRCSVRRSIVRNSVGGYRTVVPKPLDYSLYNRSRSARPSYRLQGPITIYLLPPISTGNGRARSEDRFRLPRPSKVRLHPGLNLTSNLTLSNRRNASPFAPLVTRVNLPSSGARMVAKSACLC